MKSLLSVTAFLFQNAIISASPLIPRGSSLCAYPGYQQGTDSFITTNDGGYVACSALCSAHPECKSFAWSTSECNLYDVDVNDNLVLNYASPYLFYDKGCETEDKECGIDGYQYQFDPFFYSNSISLSTCVATCTKDKGCKSYAYGNGECFLFAEPVTGNVDGIGKGSPYHFYDVACPLPSGASATTSGGLKTTTKSTTTTGKSPSSRTTTTSTSTRGSTTTSTTTAKTNSTTSTTSTTTTSSKTSTKSFTTTTTSCSSSSKTLTTTTRSSTISSSTTKSSTTNSTSSTKTTITSNKTSPVTTTTNTTKPNSITTKSTTKLTTSTATLSSPPSASTVDYYTLNCGRGAYNSIDPITTTSDGATYHACLNDCLSNPQCLTFSFTPSTSLCQLFNTDAWDASHDGAPGVPSPNFYYDIDCAKVQMCGVSGYDSTFESYWDSPAGASYTQQTCEAKCAADKDVCMSFAVGVSGDAKGECHLYGEPAFGNVVKMGGSDYLFWDGSCFGSAVGMTTVS